MPFSINSYFTKQYGNSFLTSVISGSGKDINNFMKNGIYSTDGTLPSSTGMKNYPVDVTAHILVISSTYIVTQIYISHDASRIYVRGKYRDHDFSDWKLIKYQQ